MHQPEIKGKIVNKDKHFLVDMLIFLLAYLEFILGFVLKREGSLPKLSTAIPVVGSGYLTSGVCKDAQDKKRSAL